MPFSIETIGKGFFNPDAILKGLAREKRKALSKAGAYTRTSAKSSLKYGKGSSPRGKPPTVHKSLGFVRSKKVKGVETKQPTSPLRELIYFAWDEASESVVVGPAIFGGSKEGPGKVPGILEQTHPTMVPAMKANADKFPDLFRGILR